MAGDIFNREFRKEPRANVSVVAVKKHANVVTSTPSPPLSILPHSVYRFPELEPIAR